MENAAVQNSVKVESETNVEPRRNFTLGKFEGPLDLLLFLIKKNEINIYDIPIAEVTEQFLEYLDFAVTTDLDSLTEFYSMASDLLYIKSRMLLPVENPFEGEEIDDPRQELVDKLIEYQKFKKLSLLMEEREDADGWSIERKKSQRVLPFEEENLWEQVDTWALMKTFSKLVSAYSTEQILSMYEEITVSEKITLMDELLEDRGECYFTDLVIRKDNLMDIVCAFMAILEAVKFKMASIYQNRMFGDIKIRPYKAA